MLTYRIDNKSKLVIKEQVINTLNKYKQKERMDESGGVLLGTVKKDYSEFRIVQITEPSQEDKSGRYYFERDKDKAQKIINKKWEESLGEIIYLGEWHTHPERIPSPSIVDDNLIKESLEKNIMEIDTLFLIILGNTGNLYVGFRNNKMDALQRLKKER